MSPSFRLDLGPFSFAVSTGPDGITYERGTTKLYFEWRRIAGAVLVREQPNQAEGDQQLEMARVFFGKSFDLETIKTLRDSMGTIHIWLPRRPRAAETRTLPDPTRRREFSTRHTRPARTTLVGRSR